MIVFTLRIHFKISDTRKAEIHGKFLFRENRAFSLMRLPKCTFYFKTKEGFVTHICKIFQSITSQGLEGAEEERVTGSGR